jgi:translation initiation factor 3 subunit G
LKTAAILCRICKGEHWTNKCPFKDTHGEASTAPAEEPAKTGKYIPPSLRNRTEAAPGTGTSFRDRRDENTIRITNLSEDTFDSDLRELVSKFGQITRIFVSRDKATSLCKGFAFVSFAHKDDAERAIEKLNGHGYDNLILKAEWSNK